LSEARAKAVFDFLVNEGIAANRLSYKGFGSTQAIISNEAIANLKDPKQIAAAHQKNRRTCYKIVP
jgi:outer membrane protein OmpA-like peptidoglycan-associated protein